MNFEGKIQKKKKNPADMVAVFHWYKFLLKSS